jgi:hypothetical protein
VRLHQHVRGVDKQVFNVKYVMAVRTALAAIARLCLRVAWALMSFSARMGVRLMFMMLR